MTVQIDTTAVIKKLRLQQQSSHFVGDPETGYAWLYVTSGSSPHGGLFLETENGAIVGPFITGTTNFFPNNLIVPPVYSEFTWINKETGTCVEQSGGLYLSAPPSSGNDVRALVKAAPSPPYTITAMVIPDTVDIDYAICGLCFRQSSDGKLVLFEFYATGQNIWIQNYTNETTWSAHALQNYVPNWGRPMWMRIADDNTNRICSISYDGINFRTVFSVGRTNFLTADQVGFFAESNNATSSAGILVLSWIQG